MGKAYVNRKPKKDRPEGDFYPTPKSLVWVAKEMIQKELCKDQIVFEPCSGSGMISSELEKMGYKVAENELYKNGVDYLKNEFSYRQIMTNPPFSLWDEFVTKSKKEADKVIFIGRLNYFGTTSRLHKGLWDELKSVYVFDRYVDYRTEEREDGLFNVGAMATAWFVWEKGFSLKPTLDFLSVQQYSKLGNK
jgi:hypothetical protein